jgi:hypothetical protein
MEKAQQKKTEFHVKKIIWTDLIYMIYKDKTIKVI